MFVIIFINLFRGAIADKPDEQIFFIEKAGDKNVLEKINKKDKKLEEQKKKSKTKTILENLNIFKKLQPTSKVPAIKAKVGPNKKKKSLLEDDKKFAKRWADIEKGNKRAKQLTEERISRKLGAKKLEVYDLWNDNPIENNKKEDDDELNELEDIRLTMIGAKSPKIPSHRYKKPSALPQVELPHPGQSYNPSFDDYQDLIRKANEIEMKKIVEEKHLERVLDEYFPTADEFEKNLMDEMTQGLGLNEDKKDEDEKNDESNKETNELAKSNVTNKKKTKAQRNKELRLKSKKLILKNMKQEKARDNEIFKLKQIKKQIKNAEKLSKQRQERKSQRLKEKLFKPHVLSKYKYQDPDLELNLSHELAGTLRAVRSDGNLLEDRFKSLQRRNVIEVRKRIEEGKKVKTRSFERSKRKE